MARELELKKETKITIIPKEEVVLSTDKISVDLVTDDGKTVIAHISFFNSTGATKILTLWDGEGYVKIGQWTDDDVNKRIVELINK